MLKSTNEETPNAPAYPCLMKSPVTQNIYLMTSRDSGTRVSLGSANEDSQRLGKRVSDLHRVDLEPYYGTVTLIGEK